MICNEMGTSIYFVSTITDLRVAPADAECHQLDQDLKLSYQLAPLAAPQQPAYKKTESSALGWKTDAMQVFLNLLTIIHSLYHSLKQTDGNLLSSAYNPPRFLALLKQLYNSTKIYTTQHLNLDCQLSHRTIT